MVFMFKISFVLAFIAVIGLAYTHDPPDPLSKNVHNITKRHINDGEDSPMSSSEVENRHADLKTQLHKIHRRHRKRSDTDYLTSSEIDEKRASIEEQLRILNQRRVRRYDNNRQCCARCIERGDSIDQCTCCQHLQTQPCPHIRTEKCVNVTRHHHHCPYIVPDRCGIPLQGSYYTDQQCCAQCIYSGNTHCVEQSACCQRVLTQPCPYTVPDNCGIPVVTHRIRYDYDRLCCAQCMSRGSVECIETPCCQRVKQTPCPHVPPTCQVPELPPVQPCPPERKCPEYSWSEPEPVKLQCPANVKEICGVPEVKVVTRRVPKIFTFTQSPLLYQQIEQQILQQLDDEIRIYRQVKKQHLGDLEDKARHKLNETYYRNLEKLEHRIETERKNEIIALTRDHELKVQSLEHDLKAQQPSFESGIEDYEQRRRQEIQIQLNRIKSQFDRSHQEVVDVVDVVDVVVGQVPVQRVVEPGPTMVHTPERVKPIIRYPEQEVNPPVQQPSTVAKCCDRCSAQSCGDPCPIEDADCVPKKCNKCRCNHAFVTCN